jgi:hypothetical protein
LRVGNIAAVGQRLLGSARNAVALPTIHVELNSWGWNKVFPPGMSRPPRDWTHIQSDCSAVWPFNPSQPDPLESQLTVPRDQLGLDKVNTRGPYVRMTGSLVTDSPHDVEQRAGTWFCRNLAICTNDDFVWEGSVLDWAPGMSPDDPNHPARWTEMHPLDLIELDDKDPRVTVRGLALAARAAALPGIIPSCESQEFDVYPETPRPPNSVVGYEELRGSFPEVYFPWGESQDNGSWVTNLGDHIHVKAKVCGGAFGSPGRFKALYRVWWTPTQQLTPLPLAYYRVRTFAGKALDVAANSCADGAHVIQYTWNGGDNQRWRFDRQSDGTYVIVNKASQKVLDVTGGPAALAPGPKSSSGRI